MFEKLFKSGNDLMSVSLVGDVVVIKINNETVKCLDVEPSLADERFQNICDNYSNSLN